MHPITASCPSSEFIGMVSAKRTDTRSRFAIPVLLVVTPQSQSMEMVATISSIGDQKLFLT